jgi:hypothetical protein
VNSTANNIFRNIFGNIVTESHIARLATIVVASASCHADAQSSGSVIVWGPPCKQTCGSPEFGGPLTEFSVANTHVAAIGHGGLVVCWGGNSHGQCNVPADLGPVVSVAAAEQITVAVRADGTVRCWGYNNYGQCNVPANLPPAKKVGAGREHTIALLADGTVRGWGHNSWGQSNNPGATHVSHVDCAWYSSFALIGAPCPGDIFQNGQVDGADLGILLSQWGSAQSNPVGDLNGDLVVDGGDLAILLGSWGPCPE